MPKDKNLNPIYYGGLGGVMARMLKLLFLLAVSSTISFVCWVIKVVTYEPNTRKRLTVRKARRIRALTKLKLWFYRNFPRLCDFLEMSEYLEIIHKKFESCHVTAQQRNN